MDISRLSTWDKVVGVAGLVMSLSLFAPWWQIESPRVVSLGGDGVGVEGGETVGVSGWEGLAFIDIIVFVAGLAVAGLIAAKAFGRRVTLPISTGALIAVIGLTCAALAIYRTAEPPTLATAAGEAEQGSGTEPDSGFGGLFGEESGGGLFGEDESIGIPGVGEISTGGPESPELEPLFAVVAAILGGLIVFGGWKLMRAEGTTPGEQLSQLRERVAGGGGGAAGGAAAASKAPASPHAPAAPGAAPPPPPPPPPAASSGGPAPADSPPPPTATPPPPPPPSASATRSAPSDPSPPPPPPPPSASPAGPAPPDPGPPPPAPSGPTSPPRAAQAAAPPKPESRVTAAATPAPGGPPRPAGADKEARPRSTPLIVGLIVVAVAGVAVWENLIRDEGSGVDPALAESAEQAASEDPGAVPPPDTGVEEDGLGSTETSEGIEGTAESSELYAEQAARGFPAESERAMEGDIQTLLVDYHTAVVGRRFDEAWRLLTERKRQKFAREDGRAAWNEAQGSLSPYLQPAGLRARIDELEDDGVARVRVSGMGWTQPGSACSEWSGLTWVRYENGSWRYDPGYATTPERERAWGDRSDALLGAAC